MISKSKIDERSLRRITVEIVQTCWTKKDADIDSETMDMTRTTATYYSRQYYDYLQGVENRTGISVILRLTLER